MNKRQKLIRGLVTVIASHGGISAAPAAEVTSFHEMTAMEQTAHVETDVGKAADDISSADDVAKKAEAIDHQLTSEADAHPSPEANPEGDDPQKLLLDLEGKREEEKQEEAKEDVALGDREEVSAGNIIAPASPASRESAVTGEARAEAAGEAEGAEAGHGPRRPVRRIRHGPRRPVRRIRHGPRRPVRRTRHGPTTKVVSRPRPKTRSGSDAQPRRASPERKPG